MEIRPVFSFYIQDLCLKQSLKVDAVALITAYKLSLTLYCMRRKLFVSSALSIILTRTHNTHDAKGRCNKFLHFSGMNKANAKNNNKFYDDDYDGDDDNVHDKDVYKFIRIINSLKGTSCKF